MLGRYELLEQVGSGGMAVVYRGRDTALDREVAVKLLHPHLAGAADSRARFSREARAVARLSHPGIVEIFDYAGDAAQESFLVTEFVRGRTLRRYAVEVGFGFPELAMLVGRALADALVHAHSAGVIHRDLKPENVLVDEGPRPAVKLADFGIARILASDERMTMTGALVGSPHHMAPEIVEGKEADARSDLFSLGTLLYWLATGRLPFAAGNPTAILRRVLEGAFEDPRSVEPRVPGALAAVLSRCLSVDPRGRPGSAAEVRDALDAVLAEVGIAQPQEELIAFLRDPAAFKAAFPARAVAALGARADEALAAGASARALALFDRILAIDPANAEVPAKLARLSRRRRLRRAAAWAGGAAAAAVAVALAARAVVSSAPPAGPAAPPAPAPIAASAPAAPAAEPPGAAAAGGEAGSPPEPSPPAPEPAPADASPTPPPHARREPVPTAATLAVHVRPYAQRALLDGVEVARGAQVVHFTIGADRPHVVQIEHDCCTPWVREITAAEAAGAGELRVPLEPRPARLRVEGNPSTRVFLDGRLLGTAGESQRSPFAVPVPSGGDTPYEAQGKVGLQAAGSPPRERVVRLRAGEALTVIEGEVLP
jgi:serine/threonine-protein kinase